LSSGENLVGRDPAADVRVDAVGVSRRHAMIVVGDHEVTLHDLSSKNGTYVDDVRVTSPMTLTDGIEVRFGPAVACFRRAAGMTSTQTLKASRSSRARQ
jgi:pSer/pThr/pTyr-binding forkhead associated (FHA) protein